MTEEQRLVDTLYRLGAYSCPLCSAQMSKTCGTDGDVYWLCPMKKCSFAATSVPAMESLGE